MNKINPIFEALSGVDDRHIPVTQAKRPAKKLKIALIAAVSAAALALIVGFVGTDGGKHKFSFDTGNNVEHGFYLDFTPQQFIVPDECKPLPGEISFSDYVDLPLSELFEKFGITPPINDNFTEVINERPFVDIFMPDDVPDEVLFDYVLHDNIIDENVYFSSRYFANPDKMTFSSHLGLLPGEPTEIITLKNGSLCMVSGSIAVFSYNGAKFELTLPYEYDEPDNYGELPESEQRKILAEMCEAMPGIETVKQVLSDLGVL